MCQFQGVACRRFQERNVCRGDWGMEWIESRWCISPLRDRKARSRGICSSDRPGLAAHAGGREGRSGISSTRRTSETTSAALVHFRRRTLKTGISAPGRQLFGPNPCKTSHGALHLSRPTARRRRRGEARGAGTSIPAPTERITRTSSRHEFTIFHRARRALGRRRSHST